MEKLIHTEQMLPELDPHGVTKPLLVQLGWIRHHRENAWMFVSRTEVGKYILFKNIVSFWPLTEKKQTKLNQKCRILDRHVWHLTVQCAFLQLKFKIKPVQEMRLNVSSVTSISAN